MERFMKNKKLSGSFYTPEIVADFMVSYLLDKLIEQTSISILEPSAGDGIFVKQIFANDGLAKKTTSFIAVEQSKRELNKITKAVKAPALSVIHADFLDFQLENKSKFSLVIGNPPYIKKGLLKDSQIDICTDIHASANLSDNKPKNIWTAFLVRCIEFTDSTGILAFVLPSELLQVKFAAELRELILTEFERVEIFTFNELLFKDCRGQDTLLLIGQRKAANKGIYYCNIDKLADLKERKFTLAQNAKIRESKWTHHHLETDEIELLEKLKIKLKTVNEYCDSKAGIVTAANDFFIVNDEIVNEYSLRNYVKPIIQKAVFVNGSVELIKSDFKSLKEQLKPTYLLALDEKSIIRKNGKIWKYITSGEERDLHKRFKTLLRERWYEVPNVGKVPQAFFFKRCNEYPKFIKNSAKVFATDSAYIITMKGKVSLESLIYSFYNSLTLCFAELEGRYYGGGVLELTPNEFKQLPVPYLSISGKDFQQYVSEFKSKGSIKDICRRHDAKILKRIDNDLDADSIEKVFKIREKLYMRRVKAN